MRYICGMLILLHTPIVKNMLATPQLLLILTRATDQLLHLDL